MYSKRAGNCVLCLIPSVVSTSAVSNSAFGLSNIRGGATLSELTNNANAKSSVNTDCTTDYLTLSLGVAKPSVSQTTASTTNSVGRICGRVFSNQEDQPVTQTLSICTASVPFKIGFITDDNEVIGITKTTPTPVTSASNAQKTEAAEFPAGIVGFSLDYTQTSCT